MAANTRGVPGALNEALPPGPLYILSTVLFLALSGLISSGCPPRIARITVTTEDVLRANDASRDGDIAFARKDYYAALIKYLDAGRLNPNNEFIFNRIGITYSQLRFYQEAGAAFERSIGLNSKYSYSVNNLGSVFFAQKNLKKAEKHFRKAISMKADEPSFHMNLGSLYFERKKYDQAMVEWRKGLALDPDILSKNSSVSLIGGSSPSKERSYFMARLCASAGDVLKAIENLQQAFTDGFTDIAAIEKQPDFDPIRKDERFVEFVKNMTVLIRLKSIDGAPDAVPVRQPPTGGIRKSD